MANTEILENIDSVVKLAMRPPKKFNVVFYNDDKTTVQFVVLVLMSIFHKNFEDATALTLLIHEQGRGIAGTYSYEIASQKKDETISSARLNGYPLKCEIESVDL